MTSEPEKADWQHRERCQQLRDLSNATARLEEWLFYNQNGPVPPEVLMNEFEWRLVRALYTFAGVGLYDMTKLRGQLHTRFRELGLLPPEEEPGGGVGTGEGTGDA